MSRLPDEDLFAESTMSFGDHLEELRRALIKALLWLVGGLVFGLLVGVWVVAWVQYPLRNALERYQTSDEIKEQAVARYEEFSKEHGVTLPYSIEDVRKLVFDQEQMFEIYFVHPDILNERLSQATGASSDGTTTAENDSASDSTDASSNETGVKQNDQEGASEGDLDAKGKVLAPIVLWRPMTDEEKTRTVALSPQEAFMLYLKASLLAGFVFASPMIFREIWLFVAAGLYPNEKRYVHIFLPFSVVLFLTGALFCFFVVFQYVLDYLFWFNAWLEISPDPRISEWLSFALLLPIGFGISFQLPLVMLFLERIGVFDVPAYLSKWRIAVMVIAVVAMFLTPADPMSMIAMAVPLTGLYFFGVLLCKYFPKQKSMLEA